MQIHQLRPIHKKKKGKRIGRGGKRGTYSGRGVKGQKARAGRKLKPIIREIMKKYPKQRGYRFQSKKKYVIVNLRDLQNKFSEGELVNPEVLVEKQIAKRVSGKIPEIKILGKGDITIPLKFERLKFSKSALEKVKRVGGQIL